MALASLLGVHPVCTAYISVARGLKAPFAGDEQF